MNPRDNMEPFDTDQLAPPPPGHEGGPQPTVEDPSAAGWYCAARRHPGQIQQDIDAGNPHPWPWCRMRAGRGTDHVGVGSCNLHAGNTPNGRRSAMLRYAQLHAAAVETFARALVVDDCPWPSKIRAAENIADRAGYPRRVEIDTDAGRRRLLERARRWMEEDADGDPSSNGDHPET